MPGKKLKQGHVFVKVCNNHAERLNEPTGWILASTAMFVTSTKISKLKLPPSAQFNKFLPKQHGGLEGKCKVRDSRTM